ncbi:ribonuclease J [Erythrobacteraceae bacterium CFH 75059]|uniref:ribonuclease J n=1 Tax=Qipengyuania thermophila TaxID=2509361 RepID=UPI00101F9771|nr:ribonuclease J [Qipengyuania thermophila]TCD05287.1 ribonuclease J [Erythrobacteraceae bacterium CFH 75059]
MKNGTPENELLFLALGGSGEVGMNVTLYGCDGKWLMVDLGMTFSGGRYPGVDLVFPDLEFVEERLSEVVGLVITHGHEDHIGAIPYLADELHLPIYAMPFAAELIARKLAEAGLSDRVEVHVIDALREPFRLGPFTLTFLPMAHSIAEANALLIDTAHGRVFHSGDWKFDAEPIIDEPADLDELRALGDEGVLALVSDSTNVFKPTPSGSEGAVYKGLLEEVRRHPDSRIVVTTFASNVARLQSLGEVARETGRQICVAGRSIDRIIEVAQQRGYLVGFPRPISAEEAMQLPRGQVMVLATGGQGEPRAALARMAEGTHPVELAEGDVVLFSSRQIPGNEVAVGQVQNALAGRGIRMVMDDQRRIHVSGHPGQPELNTLIDCLRPDILVPVHGELRHLVEHARLGKARGVPHSLLQKNGDIVRLAPGTPEVIARVRTGRLVLDGDLIIPADGDAVTARRRLAANGLVVVVAQEDAILAVHSFGLPLDEDHEQFVEEAVADAGKAARRRDIRRSDAAALQEAMRVAVRQAARRWSGKNPQVHVIQI